MTIVFIGAGNLATCLSQEMQRAGMTISQVYSRTENSAQLLANKLNCQWTTSLSAIRQDADLYIFSVKDSVLDEVLAQMQPNTGLWVHTAGSIPMEVFARYTSHYGVFYPLQTFSKGRTVSFENLPILLESSTEKDGKLLHNIATALSGNVQFLSSEKRKHIHLAAVFACNYTNHMYTLAGKIVEEQGISYKILLPLIEETAAKIQDMPPLLAQTGPAIRYDENVINKQVELLAHKRWKEIYLLMSQSIHKEMENE
ncbi:DUF2520 domain-containing protein [Parabacteroides sp. 52]|uniref:Rossmann-like and DUF2520 domain-containing protein n=1 Tax=unclassified Parabacteroides TaxID=2649774 RepID=UPI0013D5AD5C|nr:MULTISPECIES: Rossmann-like and DUF2520 domain-containing protein [unclassified Parabacteroides]MDH6533662.1 putative short-subunit dehydrogenase-like oxidoreductase (DUF2520 family) [Parabacteroides sp. PM5-20]NDV54414.1 DUF2520 domain-containing protein [Parabacteroides sp. 52]